MDADDWRVRHVGLDIARAVVAANDRLAMDLCGLGFADCFVNGVDGMASSEMAVARVNRASRYEQTRGYLGQLPTSLDAPVFPQSDANGFF